jgi:hypothetical protein
MPHAAVYSNQIHHVNRLPLGVAARDSADDGVLYIVQ